MSEIEKNLIDEIKQIIDITSRIDERVKMITESQQQVNMRLNHAIDEHNSLVSRVHVLESKNGTKLQELLTAHDEKLMRMTGRLEMVEMVATPKQQRIIEGINSEIRKMDGRVKELEDHKQGVVDKLKKIWSYIWQGLFIIIMCYVLWRLGLSPGAPLLP